MSTRGTISVPFILSGQQVVLHGRAHVHLEQLASRLLAKRLDFEDGNLHATGRRLAHGGGWLAKHRMELVEGDFARAVRVELIKKIVRLADQDRDQAELGKSRPELCAPRQKGGGGGGGGGMGRSLS